jgi:hypothetical protein
MDGDRTPPCAAAHPPAPSACRAVAVEPQRALEIGDRQVHVPDVGARVDVGGRLRERGDICRRGEAAVLVPAQQVDRVGGLIRWGI